MTVTAVLLLLPAGLKAQFYVTGDNPGRLKWNTIDTDNFSIIYPQGSDSLAREYGYKLEKYRLPVSRSTGYLNKGRMPVVMHAYNAANGSVAWAPKRMDLFTIPSPYSPEPLPWSTMLSVHEGRHVTQMQFGMTKAQKPFVWVFGEMWNILASLIYPGLSNIEGDAVIAETGRLTESCTELDESRMAELNGVLQKILEREDTRPHVVLTYFREDDRKGGGAYLRINGRVRKLDICQGRLLLKDGTAVDILQLRDIELL